MTVEFRGMISDLDSNFRLISIKIPIKIPIKFPSGLENEKNGERPSAKKGFLK